MDDHGLVENKGCFDVFGDFSDVAFELFAGLGAEIAHVPLKHARIGADLLHFAPRLENDVRMLPLQHMTTTKMSQLANGPITNDHCSR